MGSGKDFGRSCQLLINKFFDPCTFSMRNVDDGGKNILFRGVICCSGGLYAVQEGYMDAQEGCVLLGGLYAVQGGYMLFRRVI